jgi:hypothetical protein
MIKPKLFPRTFARIEDLESRVSKLEMAEDKQKIEIGLLQKQIENLEWMVRNLIPGNILFF